MHRTAEAPRVAPADTSRPALPSPPPPRIDDPTPAEAAQHRARALDANMTPGFDDDGQPVLYARDGTYRKRGANPFHAARRVAVGQILGRTRATIDREIRDGTGYIVVTLIQPRGRAAQSPDAHTIRADTVRAFFAQSHDARQSREILAGDEDAADRRLMNRLRLTFEERDCIRRVRALALVHETDHTRRRDAGIIVQVPRL